jgi:hypothetical protein
MALMPQILPVQHMTATRRNDTPVDTNSNTTCNLHSPALLVQVAQPGGALAAAAGQTSAQSWGLL